MSLHLFTDIFAGGRPPAFDTTAYRPRNTAERAFNKLKAFRGRDAHRQT